MRLIYYSIACMAGSRCEAQCVESIRSLRRHNERIEVCIFVYGAPQSFLIDEARRFNVELRMLGPYIDCFAHLPPYQADVLTCYRTLHKVLSLRHCPLENAEQVLYLDCDTYFFDDVAQLFERAFFERLRWCQA